MVDFDTGGKFFTEEYERNFTAGFFYFPFCKHCFSNDDNDDNVDNNDAVNWNANLFAEMPWAATGWKVKTQS